MLSFLFSITLSQINKYNIRERVVASIYHKCIKYFGILC